MGHSLVTPNVGLPVFRDTDKPAWVDDFNGAMFTLDHALAGNPGKGQPTDLRITVTNSEHVYDADYAFIDINAALTAPSKRHAYVWFDGNEYRFADVVGEPATAYKFSRIQIADGVATEQVFTIDDTNTVEFAENKTAAGALNVEIESDGFDGFRANYNDSEINNFRNAGGVVQARYTEASSGKTYTYYYSTMEADRRPTFIRTFIEEGKVVQILASVSHDKTVTVERREMSGGGASPFASTPVYYVQEYNAETTVKEEV